LAAVATATPVAGGDRVTIEPEEVPVGGIAVVRVDYTDATGTFGKKPLRFFRSGAGSMALLGIDLDDPPGLYRVLVSAADGALGSRELRVVRKTFPVERLTVPKTYTELDPMTLRRVQREQRRLDALWSATGPERYWDGAFVMPAAGPSGSPFGLRRFFNGEPRSPHAGIDIKAPAGTPVHASNRGRVALADELFFTGKTVVLDHGHGLFTLYVHLSEIAVKPDVIVEKGAAVGRVGATGRATGPHLHFAARIGEARVDPQALLGRVVD
ncbi:MAG: M23 family metallopeptidase, partial [Candidatus Binatia bacterium]